MRITGRILITALLHAFATLAWASPPEDMKLIEAGSYRPLFVNEGEDKSVAVKGFYLDQFAVTNAQFRNFVENNPQWHPDTIKPIFSDRNYLKHWQDSEPPQIKNKPVTNVSWFAARAYCKAKGKRLPSFDEWEYAAAASATSPDGTREPEFREKLLQWYSRPAILTLPDVQDSERNYWGVYGMHGIVWELIDNFNNTLVTGESRSDSELENQLFCGAGAAGSVDPSDYAAFMRYAMRSSYEANYTMQSMGFRCAQSLTDHE